MFKWGKKEKTTLEKPETRGKWVGRSHCAGSPLQAEARQETAFNANPIERSPGVRLLHRLVDHASGRQGDREAFWGGLSPQSFMETLGRSRMELSETGEASAGERREGHRALETLSVAPYKKTPKSVPLIWSFSTRVGFLSFLTSVAAGPPKDRRPSFDVSAAIGPKSRRFRPSAFLPKEDGSGSTPDSIRIKTFVTPTSLDSSVICSGTCGVPWSFSGTVEIPIEEQRSKTSFKDVRALRPSVSRHTLRNSTRRNSFGTNSSDLWPIVSQKISVIFGTLFNRLSNAYGSLRGYYGRAFMHQLYLGNNMSYYLCVIQ